MAISKAAGHPESLTTVVRPVPLKEPQDLRRVRIGPKNHAVWSH